MPAETPAAVTLALPAAANSRRYARFMPVIGGRAISRQAGRRRGARGCRCPDARMRGVTSPRFDLVVRGGTLVRSGHREHAAIAVRDGRTAQFDGPMAVTKNSAPTASS
jgi:hypothetical protein